MVSEIVKVSSSMISWRVMALILYLLLGTSTLVGVLLGGRLLLLFRRFARTGFPALPADLDALPTVSVCIPARNETHAMTQCLERVIASRYPKLEIIVLDDSSIDNTSILIKSFAHAGVRFVEGSPLPEDWLGKAHAQHALYHEASGEYILYLDVDTHLSPQSIDGLIATALHDKAAAISVLPTRDDAWRASVLFATLRHFWSIVSHTRAHPAASSSAWLVEKRFLREQFDGLTQLKLAVAPERLVAAAAAQRHAYRFLVSTPALGVSYEKKWLSQCQTSIRLLYPFFGGKPLLALGGVLLLGLLLLPFAVVLTALVFSWQPIHTLALVAALILLFDYIIYTDQVWRGGWLVGGLLFPVVLIQECVLLLRSMYAYATHTVTWKGRPIRQTARSAAEG